MNCDQFRKRLRESSALEAAAAAHVDGCAACAALFQQQRRLEAGLKQMAAAQVGWSAPPRVEAALVQQFRSEAKRQMISPAPARKPFWMRFRLPGLAAAGVLATALALLLISRTPHSSPTVARTAATQASELDDDSALDNGFVLLPYANSGEITNAAEADVVRVEMPRSALVTLGVPVSDDGNSATVEAELLLGEGGVPQAVRVLE
ncbi:MAG TPA: hypothetical protein VH640_19855 [Bryobacteraceae bacterium]